MLSLQWRKKISKLFLIPQRYILGIMGLLAVCNAYTMRVCLNLAVTQMVNNSRTETSQYDPDACPEDDVILVNGTVSLKPHAIFEWSESTQGLILSGFYYGYAITQVPGGYLAEKYGGKWTLGIGLLSTAIFTMLTPVVVKAGGATWLFILRVLQGMGEGPTMPALMIVLARWVPPHERSRQGALVFGGAQIGNIFGSFMSGFLMAGDGDWANVFYFFGSFGILWFILWSLLCFSTPNTHPYISEEELKYLNEHVTSAETSSVRDPVPWKAIVRSVPVWALLFAAVGHDWGYYTMVTDLPKYMTDVLKFNIAATGTLTAIPYLAMWISSFIFGLICDVCVKRNWHSIKTGRIIHTTIVFLIPQRYILGIMGLLAVCNAYTMRVCLNLAVTQMVNNSRTETSQYDPDACPEDDVILVNGTVSLKPHAIFEWSESTQGLILSGFYYGYAITQVPGGYLAEKYGGKWTLGIGLLSTAIFTMLTPVVVKAGGATWLFILRVLQGMGEGPTMPALMIVLARWVPPHERSRQGALVFGGAQIGNIFGSFMSGFLMAGDGDWANVFYFFGSFGILWFILWSLLCFSTPNTHPYISEEELKYLNEHVTSAETSSVRDPVPWKAIVRSVPVWALLFAAVGHDWGYYTMVTDLPKYMTDVLKFNIAATGTLTAIPYLAMWISSFIFGLICDVCVKRNWHSIKTGRIIHTTIAATGPAICIILASYAGCDRYAAVAYFIASMALMGGYYSGMKVNALDLAPNYAGSVTAMVNGTSTISGIITPYLIGLLTPDSTLKQWRVAFWVCFAVLVGTNVIYNIWADGKQQWWDDVRQHGYPDEWKHGLLKLAGGDKEKNLREKKFKETERVL